MVKKLRKWFISKTYKRKCNMTLKNLYFRENTQPAPPPPQYISVKSQSLSIHQEITSSKFLNGDHSYIVITKQVEYQNAAYIQIYPVAIQIQLIHQRQYMYSL
jgi:hypothetical protein